jgi:predicted DNA binding CopG/RHH family protein
MKAQQLLSDEYLRECLESTLEQRMEFLESFRAFKTGLQEDPTILISMKIKQSLLDAFKLKCSAENSKYQTKIKELMHEYLEDKL